MSNYLAITAVTAVLKEIIEKSIQASGAVSGNGPTFACTTLRPSHNDVTKRGVNVFLHHVTPNAQWRNADLPARRSGGAMVQRPTAAVDLQYVLTFHGEESRWEPQRYLGVVLSTLHGRPTLSRELVKKALDAIGATQAFAFIRESDLHRAVEQVRFTQASLSLDELSKIWSSFYQTQYSLSAVYTASPVLIELDETPQEALPVRSAFVRVVPFAQPVIDRVRRGNDEPITAVAAIRVEGQRLRGDFTRLLLDDVVHTGTIDVSHDLVTTTLPATMFAGIHRAQIVHLIGLGTPATPHRGVESNVAPFMLQPSVTGPGTITERTSRVVDGVTLISGTLTIPLSPVVERTQRVLLLLNPTTTAISKAYSFTAAPRPDGPGDPLTTPTVPVVFTDVQVGTYYVRAQVDGATSVPVPGPDFPELSIS